MVDAVSTAEEMLSLRMSSWEGWWDILGVGVGGVVRGISWGGING